MNEPLQPVAEITVDVIIPCRDVDDYLSEAIASAIGQVGVITNVIVVDAGSTVPIVLAPEWAEHERVTLVRSAKGLLCGGARNAGIARASADVITFLDADDRWNPERTRKLLDALSPGRMVMGQIEHFSDGQTGLNVPAGIEVALVAGGMLIGRADFDRVGLFDEDLRAAEFIDWFNRARVAGVAVTQVTEVSLSRRVHAASSTATQMEARMDYLKVVRRWMNRND
jgi:glycosyltransferase involved in cell wall biosynthesis